MARYQTLGSSDGVAVHIFDDLVNTRVGAQQVGDSTLLSIFKNVDTDNQQGATFTISDPAVLTDLAVFLMNEAQRIRRYSK